MRIWDISPKNLCRKHLIAEHGELHSLWSIIINNKRGYRHNSPLDIQQAKGKKIQDIYLDKPLKQKMILKNKLCDCFTFPKV